MLVSNKWKCEDCGLRDTITHKAPKMRISERASVFRDVPVSYRLLCCTHSGAFRCTTVVFGTECRRYSWKDADGKTTNEPNDTHLDLLCRPTNPQYINSNVYFLGHSDMFRCIIIIFRKSLLHSLSYKINTINKIKIFNIYF